MTDQPKGGSVTPEKGTAQWKRNEKLINETPALKQLRDVSEGFSERNSSRISTGTVSEQYKANYDKIDWTKK